MKLFGLTFVMTGIGAVVAFMSINNISIDFRSNYLVYLTVNPSDYWWIGAVAFLSIPIIMIIVMHNDEKLEREHAEKY